VTHCVIGPTGFHFPTPKADSKIVEAFPKKLGVKSSSADPPSTGGLTFPGASTCIGGMTFAPHDVAGQGTAPAVATSMTGFVFGDTTTTAATGLSFARQKMTAVAGGVESVHDAPTGQKPASEFKKGDKVRICNKSDVLNGEIGIFFEYKQWKSGRQAYFKLERDGKMTNRKPKNLERAD